MSSHVIIACSATGSGHAQTRDQCMINFVQFDQLNYNDETIDNQLTALFAYYAYLIIGLDLDSFAPLGGTDILH